MGNLRRRVERLEGAIVLGVDVRLLSDEELEALIRAAPRRLAADLRSRTDEELLAMLRGKQPRAVVEGGHVPVDAA